MTDSLLLIVLIAVVAAALAGLGVVLWRAPRVRRRQLR